MIQHYMCINLYSIYYKKFYSIVILDIFTRKTTRKNGITIITIRTCLIGYCKNNL